jgi:RNA polymerase sigma factor (sigma-70 family)
VAAVAKAAPAVHGHPHIDHTAPTPSQAKTVCDPFVGGVEDYYLGSGETPGRWIGSGSVRLGLSGVVAADELGAVLDGRCPATGRSMIAVRRPDRLPGFDLTFSAPKSVSLLFAVFDEKTSLAVRRAHDAAVAQALGYLEREAGEVRRGRDGVDRLPGGGFVAAAFRHRSSRAGDPQLHTHVLVANMTRGADGRWSALDGRQIYLQAKTAGTLYQTVLRYELRRLGLEFVLHPNGTCEIGGVPAHVRARPGVVTDRTAVEDLLRELALQVLGVLVRRYGDFADAEDAVQEALLAAATQWRAEGLPDNPRGWLIAVAVRRLTDRWRSDEARRRREDLAAVREPAAPPEVSDEDDSLPLLFLCCHHALTPGSAIPLTLRAVGGLTTAEIARAFLVPEATMAQRISRAKQRIKASDVPFRMPTPAEWAERLRSVLHVLYLIFNEGYTSSIGPALHRSELSGEAIRLARAVHRLLPDDAEVGGLLALMLLTDARRTARTGPGGELIPLAEQDRTLWDRQLIREGSL